jgi:hypothetical protein
MQDLGGRNRRLALSDGAYVPVKVWPVTVLDCEDLRANHRAS